MDPNWSLAPPKGSLPCLLCKSVISFANKDKSKYFKHLTLDHGAFFNMNLVLIINLLEKAQLLELIKRIKGEGGDKERRKKTKDAEVQTQEVPVSTKESDEEMMVMEHSARGSDEDPLLDDGEITSSLDVTKDVTKDDPKQIQETSSILPCLDSESEASFESSTESNLSENVSPEEPMDVEKVQNIIAESKSNQDMVSVYLQNCSEYFKKFPHQLKSCSTGQVDRFDQVDPTFPSGWKVKITHRSNPSLSERAREIREFLSPEFKIFRSKVAVVEYMRAMGGYDDAEMHRILPMQVKKEL